MGTLATQGTIKKLEWLQVFNCRQVKRDVENAIFAQNYFVNTSSMPILCLIVHLYLLNYFTYLAKRFVLDAGSIRLLYQLLP